MFTLDMPGDLGFVKNKLSARIDSICIQISKEVFFFHLVWKENSSPPQKCWSELMFPEWEN